MSGCVPRVGMGVSCDRVLCGCSSTHAMKTTSFGFARMHASVAGNALLLLLVAVLFCERTRDDIGYVRPILEGYFPFNEIQ